MVYPSSGTGAWEAALVNTLSPGDRVLISETGHFSWLWSELAGRLGLTVEVLRATGATVPIPTRSASASPPTPGTRSAPCAWCTTRPRPA